MSADPGVGDVTGHRTLGRTTEPGSVARYAHRMAKAGTFMEVCVYEVRSDRTEEFEDLIREVAEHHRKHAGTIDVRYLKRTHRHKDFQAVKTGTPAQPLVRAAKSVTYVLCWELDGPVAHGKATKSGLGRFYPRFRRCLTTAPKIMLGTRIA